VPSEQPPRSSTTARPASRAARPCDSSAVSRDEQWAMAAACSRDAPFAPGATRGVTPDSAPGVVAFPPLAVPDGSFSRGRSPESGRRGRESRTFFASPDSEEVTAGLAEETRDSEEAGNGGNVVDDRFVDFLDDRSRRGAVDGVRGGCGRAAPARSPTRRAGAGSFRRSKRTVVRRAGRSQATRASSSGLGAERFRRPAGRSRDGALLARLAQPSGWPSFLPELCTGTPCEGRTGPRSSANQRVSRSGAGWPRRAPLSRTGVSHGGARRSCCRAGRRLDA